MAQVRESDDALAEAALDAACEVIQRALGQTDGGVAGVFFGGESGDVIRRLFREYIALERAMMAQDGEA